MHIHAHQLFAIYSGGLIDLDHAGYQADIDSGFTEELGTRQGKHIYLINDINVLFCIFVYTFQSESARSTSEPR